MKVSEASLDQSLTMQRSLNIKPELETNSDQELKDTTVKEDVPRKILKKVTGKNVNIIYLKESDHRLSTETDLKMITQSIEYIRKTK